MPQSLPRPDARTLRRTAALESSRASEVLWAAGDLLRAADPEGHVEAREALARVEPAAAREAVAAIDAAACVGALARAVDAAFDAALEQDAEERELLVSTAMEDLEARDVVDCVLCAVATFDGRGDVEPTEAASLREAASKVSAAVTAGERASRGRVRELTALNDLRRARADALDDAARARVWWFTELAGAEHDGLVETLAGLDVDAGDAALQAAARATIPSERDALGAVLRVLDGGGPAREDAARWAASAAKRDPRDAIALELLGSLDVAALEDEASV